MMAHPGGGSLSGWESHYGTHPGHYNLGGDTYMVPAALAPLEGVQSAQLSYYYIQQWATC